MAKELKELTKSDDNYSQWYNDLVVKAGLAENSAVRGCMVIKPYGYDIRTPTSRSSSPSRSFPRRRTTSRASPRSAPW